MSESAVGASGDCEEARLAAVRRYDVLDTPPDGAFDRVAALAARFFGMPMATVTIVDEDRIWFKAAHGISGVSEIGRDPGLCGSAILQDEPYLLPDTLQDVEAATHPLVTGELGLRCYAAAPIVTADGYRLGTVNVLGKQPRPITSGEADTLRDLAAVVTDELELRLAAMHAVHMERELRAGQEAEMRDAMESHAAIDQALGMLMKAQHCDDAAAWEILKRISQETNTKLRVLAHALTGLATGSTTVSLDPEVEARLHRALKPMPRGRSAQ